VKSVVEKSVQFVTFVFKVIMMFIFIFYLNFILKKIFGLIETEKSFGFPSQDCSLDVLVLFFLKG
jgi:hypothetical protein